LHWTTHVLSGAATGYLIEKPIPAFIVGLASHIALDMVPHHDPETNAGYVIDSICGVSIFSLLFVHSRKTPTDCSLKSAIAGSLGAAIPDLELLYKKAFKLEEENLFFPTHNNTLPHMESGNLFSKISQAMLLILLFAAIIVRKKREEIKKF